MTEILFYHLEQRPLEQVLPVLLQKSIERGWQCVVQIGNSDKTAALDKALWTFGDESFLPHGRYVEDGENNHPILLCSGQNSAEINPNAAEARFFVYGAVPDAQTSTINSYQRLVFMFSGHDPEAVSAARLAWKSLSSDHQTTYWQQDASGKWLKKA